MDFTADQIRQLRYRLGWSQAEMARCLKLDFALVSGWESGRVQILDEHRRILASIFHQAESNAQRVQRRPIAEVIMKNRGLSQIHDFDVVDTMGDTGGEANGNGTTGNA